MDTHEAEPTITGCTVYAYQKGQSHIDLTLSNGEEKKEAIKYYSDELTFESDEFIGLTMREAYELHHRKDVEYLQS